MTQNPLRYTVALDAMGGDDAPARPVEAAIIAAQDNPVKVLLVGDQNLLEKELNKHKNPNLPLEIISSEGVINEGEHPVAAMRLKPKASIIVATGLVKSGLADAVVSMGSTGAAMTTAVLSLGVFPGLDRPALGGPFIGLAPQLSLIDLGAQLDCRPSQLLSFAALGCTFSRLFLTIDQPRVALLSVGSEAGKGNRQIQESYPLFEASGLRFVGNIEGHELFDDKADVVVCDGYVGNILLKYTEGIGQAAANFLSEHLGPDAEAVQHFRGLASAAERAGGALLGVNGISIIGHGRSKAKSISASITLAGKFLELELVDNMRKELAELLKKRPSAQS